MARICVTADDYGMHATVNAAIEDLAAHGSISAVAVMVHADAILDTLDRLLATGVSVGLHLVLTHERPVREAVEGTPLATRGRLPASPFALVRAFLRSSDVRKLLSEEVRAQADRYHSLGIPLDFINSHEHVHEVPFFWNTVADLVDRERPVAVRSAHVQPLALNAQGGLAALSRASWTLRPLRLDVQLLSPLGAGHAGQMTLARVESFVDSGCAWHANTDVLPELIFHPAIEDEPLRARYGAKVGARRAEYQLLRSDDLRDLWQRRGIEVTRPAPG